MENGKHIHEEFQFSEHLCSNNLASVINFAVEPFLCPAELTEVGNLQGMYPLKDEWVFGCSLKTRLADQTKTQQQKWLWSKDSMNSTINQRLVEQTQEVNFKL